MEIDTSTLMMIFFILSFIISMWKIYPFLKTTTLKDDDTTKESQEELISLVKKHMQEGMSSKKLLELIKNDEDFDKDHYWRFNENRLNQLLISIRAT